jgi:hypothetical protein
VTDLREEMPVIVRHEGDWIGTYTVIDLQGNILDRHASHLRVELLGCIYFASLGRNERST